MDVCMDVALTVRLEMMAIKRTTKLSQLISLEVLTLGFL